MRARDAAPTVAGVARWRRRARRQRAGGRATLFLNTPVPMPVAGGRAGSAPAVELFLHLRACACVCVCSVRTGGRCVLRGRAPVRVTLRHSDGTRLLQDSGGTGALLPTSGSLVPRTGRGLQQPAI